MRVKVSIGYHSGFGPFPCPLGRAVRRRVHPVFGGFESPRGHFSRKDREGKTMTILCLDPSSTVIGWAIIPEGCESYKDIDSGNMKPKKKNTPAHERVPILIGSVGDMIDEYGAKEVWVENTSQYGGVTTTEEVMDLLAYVKVAIKFEAEKRGLPFEKMASTSIKANVCKYAGIQKLPGEKGWKKRHSILAVQQLTGVTGLDDNERDAWALAFSVFERGDYYRKATKKIEGRQQKLALGA